LDLKSGQEAVHADVLNEAPSDLTSGHYFVRYLPDGEYLLTVFQGILIIFVCTSRIAGGW